MPLILNKDISMHVHLLTGLREIYGFGKIHAGLGSILLGVNKNIKVKSLTEDDLISLDKRLRKYNFIVGRLLERILYINTNTLIKSNAYRAIRSLQGLPSRGQRTHTNAKTARNLKGFWGKSSFAMKQRKLSEKKNVKDNNEKVLSEENKEKKQKFSVKKKSGLKKNEKSDST